jgi:hypothetical protein
MKFISDQLIIHVYIPVFVSKTLQTDRNNISEEKNKMIFNQRVVLFHFS